jgi:hypothetical protein
MSEGRVVGIEVFDPGLFRPPQCAKPLQRDWTGGCSRTRTCDPLIKSVFPSAVACD